MSIFEKGLITILCCTLLFVIIAIPLVLRKVPRNIVYGFRTRTTLSNDFVWYEANAYFGRHLITASIIATLTALVLYRMHVLSPGLFLEASIVALIAPPFVATLTTLRFIRSLTSGS